MIVLNGCGMRIMWQFPPRITHCPVKCCFKRFGVRSDAIVHYKENHAERSTLCPICNSPVIMRRFGDINDHYKRRHPNSDLPSYFAGLAKRKKSQTKRFESAPCSKNGSQPTNKVQKGSSRLSCPLKLCSYETSQMRELCEHWTQNHDELVFPQLRGKSEATQADAIQKLTTSRKVIQIVSFLILILHLKF